MPSPTSPLPSVSASTTTTATASTNGTASDLTIELLRLRERFTAYEHLDQQLDDMVTGLTELLRGAAELRRRTNQEITSALARCEALVADDRVQQRLLLTSLHTELDAAHRRTSTLSDAIDAVQRHLADITDRIPAPNGASHPSPPPSAPVQPSSASPTSIHLTVRDVPDVATALAIQRLIAEHPTVIALQTREFAAGEIRLHLNLRAPLILDDLLRLSEATFEPIEAEVDRLVVRYTSPPATTG
jgi:hypothetical protein